MNSEQRSVHVLVMPLPMTMSIQFEDGTRVAVNHGPAFVEIPLVISGSHQPSDIRRLLHELFIRHQDESRGPPPTSKAFLDTLPVETWAEKDLAAKYSDCAICLSDYECNETVLTLPCEHLFHKECGMRWLAEHNICPTCRFQLPSQQDEETDKTDRQADAGYSAREVGTQTNEQELTSGEDSAMSRGQIRTHQQILATSVEPYRVVRRRISERTDEASAPTCNLNHDLDALMDAEADALVEEWKEMEAEHDRTFLTTDRRKEKDMISGVYSERSNVEKHQEMVNSTINDLRKRLEQIEMELSVRQSEVVDDNSMRSSDTLVQTESSKDLAQLDIDTISMATAKHVFLYVPNLVGYLRVILSLYSLSIALVDYKTSLVCYACSFACDYFDGLFARWLNQCSSFGAVLDMVTDRCSTAGLLFILAHLYPAKSIYFLYILLLDFSSHWMHMYSSRGHHKTGLHERNFLLRVYYGCYPLFGYCCVGSEVFYMLLYILAFDASYKIPLIQLPLTHLCYIVCLPACVMKNIINLAQLFSAANAIATEDAEKINTKTRRIGALSLAWTFGLNANLVNGVHNLSTATDHKIFYPAAHVGIVYDLKDKTQKVLQGHCHAISACVVSEDKRWIVTADRGADSLIAFWDAITGHSVFTIEKPHLHGVEALDLSPDARFLATLGSAYKTDDSSPDDSKAHQEKIPARQELSIWDWNAATRQQRMLKPLCMSHVATEDAQRAIRFSTFNHYEIITTGCQRIIFWNWQERRLVFHSPSLVQRNFRQAIGNFTQSIFVPNSTQAVTGTDDGDIVLWESQVATVKAEKTVTSRIGSMERKATKVIRLAPSVNKTKKTAISCLVDMNGYLVIGASDGSVRFFDFEFRLLAWFENINAGPISSISFALASVETGQLEVEQDEPFLVPNFIVSTLFAFVVELEAELFREHKGGEHCGTLLLQGASDDIHGLAMHPFHDQFAVSTYSGTLQLWDLKSHRLVMVNKFNPKRFRPQCLAFSPDGKRLFVGFTNGIVKMVHPQSFEIAARFTHLKGSPITMLRVSPDSTLLVAVDSMLHVGMWRKNDGLMAHESSIKAEGIIAVIDKVLDEDERSWVFLGRCKSHSRPITGMDFSMSSTTPYRLVSVGEDRTIVEYCMRQSNASNGIVLTQDPVIVEQDAIPTACCWHPETAEAKEDLIIIANNEYKVKLYNANNKLCRKTTLGPLLGSSINRLIPINPHESVHYCAYTTPEKVVGLLKLPLDGNPHRLMGLIAHPGEITNAEVSADGRFLVTAGGNDRTIHVWEMDTERLDDIEKEGGSGLKPFYELLEGGKNGAFFNDIVDYFYYAQVRTQGECTTEERVITHQIPLESIPQVVRALGYYPSEDEIKNMLSEVKYSTFSSTTKTVHSIGLQDLVKLYINHRPVFEVDKGAIQKAFEALGGGENGDTSISWKVLESKLLQEGDQMTYIELQSCLEALVATEYHGKEANYNLQVTADTFVDEILEFVIGRNDEFSGSFLRVVDHKEHYEDAAGSSQPQLASVEKVDGVKHDTLSSVYFRRRLQEDPEKKSLMEKIFNEKNMIGLSMIESLLPPAYGMVAPYLHSQKLPDTKVNKTVDSRAHAVKLIANESILSSPLVNLSSELSSLDIKLQQEDSSLEKYELPLETSKSVSFFDFATDMIFLEARMDKTTCTIDSVERKISGHLIHCNPAPSNSAVVIFDALTPLLEDHQVADVVSFLQRLRKNTAIGSVIARHSTSCVSKSSSFALASNASALLWIETISSIQAYPVLAKERRQTIPTGKDGFILTIRNKNNGMSSETMESFRIDDSQLSLERMDNPEAEQDNTMDIASGDTRAHTKNLTFNVHTSDVEKIAKQKMKLPYQHRGSHVMSCDSTIPNERLLFYIDDDDLEWDDDDVDGDLDTFLRSIEMEKQIVLIRDELTVEIRFIANSDIVGDAGSCILTKVHCELSAREGRYMLSGHISLLDHHFKLILDDCGIDIYHDENLFVMLEIRQKMPSPRMYRFSTSSSGHRKQWTQMISLIKTKQKNLSMLSKLEKARTTTTKSESHHTNKLYRSIQPQYHVVHLVLIRHGHYTNALDPVSSDAEQVLSKIGRQQARLTATHLARTFGAPANRQDVSIHHSDMARAVETASIVSSSFPDCAVQVSPLLREGWPGSPFRSKTAETHKPAATRSNNDLERMDQAVGKYFDSSSEEHEVTVRLTICHANLIRYFICHVLGVSPKRIWGHFEINHCSITRIEFLQCISVENERNPDAVDELFSLIL
ncbi:unnamed protein product [Albugo candida]|uniref:Cilia- and flagella-associated protein 251 n=2 Tax=Albugo candida TaxID=65357 RepID=A0A024G0T5_9STRA|nr:unnamed protein product [Albugo candida]|eukprot:CCI40185.1 unnamed protein product [Albugo candida]